MIEDHLTLAALQQDDTNGSNCNFQNRGSEECFQNRGSEERVVVFSLKRRDFFCFYLVVWHSTGTSNAQVSTMGCLLEL
jgi:hypothetical protein